MGQKTITVEHPTAHQATQAEIAAAVEAEGIPEGWSIRSTVNESGVSTKVVIQVPDEEPTDERPQVETNRPKRT